MLETPVKKYAFINAKLRARLSKMLTENVFDQMIQSHTLSEAAGILQNTDYAVIHEVYSKTGDLKLAELELLKKEIALYSEIQRYMDKNTTEFIQALCVHYEIENLKNALRLFFDRKIRERDIQDSVHYVLTDKIIHELYIEKIIYAGNVEEIVKLLQATPYDTIVEKHWPTVQANQSLFSLEVALDHYYYKLLMDAVESLQGKDREQARRLIGVEIDLQNINWIMRFKNFYRLPVEKISSAIIPNGFNLKPRNVEEAYSATSVTPILQQIIKTNYPGLSALVLTEGADLSARLMLVEHVLEQIMRYEVKRTLSGYPFTIGIILSYFILKTFEMNKLQTILNAKQYEIPSERIKGLL